MQNESLTAPIEEITHDESIKSVEKKFEPYEEFTRYPVFKPRIYKDVMNTCLWINEDEFNCLSPRLVHSAYIGRNQLAKNESKSIQVHTYITSGYQMEGEKKVEIAYSYYVRYGNNTWKPWSLFDACNIIESIRVWEINEQRKEKELVKKYAKRLHKSAKK